MERSEQYITSDLRQYHTVKFNADENGSMNPVYNWQMEGISMEHSQNGYKKKKKNGFEYFKERLCLIQHIHSLQVLLFVF